MSGTTAPIPPISGNLTYNLYTGISTSTQMSTAPTLRSSSPNDTSTQMVSPSPPSPTQGTRATSRMASERGTCSRFAVPCTTHWFHLPPSTCRICVGRHIANNSIFIEAAILLWAFNFAPGKDANGNIVLPSTTECENDSLVMYVPRFLPTWNTQLILALRWPHSRPRPYACSITPRSPDIESAIAHAMEMHSIVA